MKTELIDFNVEWSLGNSARVSFIVKIDDKYIMEGRDLRGDVIFKENTS